MFSGKKSRKDPSREARKFKGLENLIPIPYRAVLYGPDPRSRSMITIYIMFLNRILKNLLIIYSKCLLHNNLHQESSRVYCLNIYKCVEIQERDEEPKKKRERDQRLTYFVDKATKTLNSPAKKPLHRSWRSLLQVTIPYCKISYEIKVL
ncbi:hypothetical protein YC2023_024585 [Brassica napus]